jgi:hypothetical protein
MWQLLTQINEANSGYILDLFCPLGYSPNERLLWLTGDPINLNLLYIINFYNYLLKYDLVASDVVVHLITLLRMNWGLR